MGWVNYFAIADMKSVLKTLDEWLRRRIRMCFWKQWKRIKTKHDNLFKLGINNSKAWEYANTRKGYWRISNSPILAKSLTNKYLEEIGSNIYTKIIFTKTLNSIEPPCTERYARWCERSLNKIIIQLLLDLLYWT